MRWYYTDFLGLKNYEDNPFAGGRYEVVIRMQDEGSNDLPAPFVTYTDDYKEAERIANYLTSHEQEVREEVRHVVEDMWQESYEFEWLEVWVSDNDWFCENYNENLSAEPWGTI